MTTVIGYQLGFHATPVAFFHVCQGCQIRQGAGFMTVADVYYADIRINHLDHPLLPCYLMMLNVSRARVEMAFLSRSDKPGTSFDQLLPWSKKHRAPPRRDSINFLRDDQFIVMTIWGTTKSHCKNKGDTSNLIESNGHLAAWTL